MLGPSRASGKHMGTDQTGTPIRRLRFVRVLSSRDVDAFLDGRLGLAHRPGAGAGLRGSERSRRARGRHAGSAETSLAPPGAPPATRRRRSSSAATCSIGGLASPGKERATSKACVDTSTDLPMSRAQEGSVMPLAECNSLGRLTSLTAQCVLFIPGASHRCTEIRSAIWASPVTRVISGQSVWKQKMSRLCLHGMSW